MAYTERYVTDSASGGDGSSGSPWTLAEAWTNAAAGDRVNIQSGSYSASGGGPSTIGTVTAPIVFRGYNTTIGDLDEQGRDTDGELDTTDFPVITTTSSLTLENFNIYQNLILTGTTSANGIVYDTGSDYCALISCSVLQLGAGSALRGDNGWVLINCDFKCTTAASSNFTVDLDSISIISTCRFESTVANRQLLQVETGSVIGCVFIGTGSTNDGLLFVPQFNGSRIVQNCTFYNLGDAISYDTASNFTSIPVLINNHITDCSVEINNLYSATSDRPVIAINNRTRDNTTKFTGIDNYIEFNEVTTDTGGAATDYEDAANGDLRLISGAPGVDAGMGIG